jgi:hypothetical protein
VQNHEHLHRKQHKLLQQQQQLITKLVIQNLKVNKNNFNYLISLIINFLQPIKNLKNIYYHYNMHSNQKVI